MFDAIRSKATVLNVSILFVLVLVLSTGTAYAAGKVRSKDIVNGQVKTVDLGNDAVTAQKILDGTITSADLASGSVNGTAILDDSITNADLGTDSVGAIEIADNTVDGGEIVNESIGQSDIAAGGVGTSEVADSSLTGADIANNSLTTADLAGTDASGAITLGSGAVANGRCRAYTISVPGAVVGQGVIITAKAALTSGIFIYGNGILATDTAVMTVCNLSGVTFPALTDFPIRTITFG